jgi:hypothetical protein
MASGQPWLVAWYLIVCQLITIGSVWAASASVADEKTLPIAADARLSG